MTDILTTPLSSNTHPIFPGNEALFSASFMSDVLDTAESNLKKVATLTLGKAPRRDLTPLLLEHLPEENIAHFGLLDGLSSADIERLYGPVAGEKVAMTHMEDGSYVMLSAAKVETALQKMIHQLERQGFENILVLCAGEYKGLKTENAILLDSYRMLPPLVNAIIGGQQPGVMVARDAYLGEQAYKWQGLASKPLFAVASPWATSDDELIDAALQLQEQGADVVVLDCLGYHQRHRDFLQKLLGIPVLLSNALLAKLAADLVE